MTDGQKILDLAVKHLGEAYVLGSVAPLNNGAYKGPWDCSEFATWCIYQISGKKVGYREGGGGAFTGYWQEDIATKCIVISKRDAKRTEGAILLKFPEDGKVGHIAFSDGNGRTVEAMNSKNGVTRGNVGPFRGWDVFLLVKGLTY